MNVRKINQLFDSDLVVINMGLETFAENLEREEVKTLQMSWRPPAGGNRRLLALLERLGR